MLIGVSIFITLLLFPNLLFSTYNYKVGDIAEKDIKSPREFFLENKAATEETRRKAAESVLAVYDFDDIMIEKLAKRVSLSFQRMREFFQEPKIEETNNVEETSKPGPVKKIPSSSAEVLKKEKGSTLDQVMLERDNFEKMLGTKITNREYSILVKERFSKTIEDEIIKLLKTVLERGVVANKQLLLLEDEKGISLRKLRSKEEVIVKDLSQFYSIDQAKVAIRNLARSTQTDLSYRVRNLVIDLAQELIQPNLTLNKSETEERKRIAIARVKPVLTQIKKGEMLLREGERVSESNLIKLNALKSRISRSRLYITTFGIFALIVIVLSVVFVVNSSLDSKPLATNRDILFLCVILGLLFFLSNIWVSLSDKVGSNIPYDMIYPIQTPSLVYGIPVAAGAITVCLFMGMRVALSFAVVMAFCNSLLFENKLEMFVYFLLNGMMGAYWVRSCKERGVLIKAGVKIGLLNVVVVTGLEMYTNSVFGPKLLWSWVFGFLGGVGSGILTVGIAPLVEMTFGYTSDTKLLELANLDQPILKRLMLEAPGTYNHSMIVGSMVEAAAAAIGANPLLAKVSAYYHDIGKIKKPLYFIENQMGGENKHDNLAPSISSLILISHVKDGVEMAKKYRLGRDIIDIIRQHHGTSLITFFYEKAKKLKGDNAINESDFRYPGPRPQTKEAGLVLLADSVEAASRTLDNPTPARIKGLVQNIINKIFMDGQLNECELTLKDLNEIANSFNKILTGIYHHRIEYPERTADTETQLSIS